MLNIFDYIENYCRVHNINAKSFKSSVLTKDKLSEKLTFAPGIAFFYKLRVTGEIQNIANFGKPFMTVDTQTDYWDFSKIGNVYDDGAIQHVESDFPFIADNMMTVNLEEGANALFQRIDSVQMFFIYVSILPYEADNANNARVYDITIDRHSK